MVLYASVEDVKLLLLPRSLPLEQDAQIDRLLELAAGLIRQQIPRVDARLADGSLDPEVVAGVSAAMVARVLRNPDGRRSSTESAGPFTESWTIDSAVSSGALYLSATEIASMSPPPRRLTIGSVRLGHWS